MDVDLKINMSESLSHHNSKPLEWSESFWPTRQMYSQRGQSPSVVSQLISTLKQGLNTKGNDF